MLFHLCEIITERLFHTYYTEFVDREIRRKSKDFQLIELSSIYKRKIPYIDPVEQAHRPLSWICRLDNRTKIHARYGF